MFALGLQSPALERAQAKVRDRHMSEVLQARQVDPAEQRRLQSICVRWACALEERQKQEVEAERLQAIRSLLCQHLPRKAAIKSASGS